MVRVGSSTVTQPMPGSLCFAPEAATKFSAISCGRPQVVSPDCNNESMASVRQVRAGRTPSLSGHVWAHDSDLILPPQSEPGYQEEIPTVQQSLAPEEKAIEVPKGEVKPAEVQPLFASARPLPPAYCRPYHRQATIPFFTAPGDNCR